MDKELPSQRDVNIFLDVVRSSGVTNMFGAAPYVATAFDMPRTEARRILSLWMNNFNEEANYLEVKE